MELSPLFSVLLLSFLAFAIALEVKDKLSNVTGFSNQLDTYGNSLIKERRAGLCPPCGERSRVGGAAL